MSVKKRIASLRTDTRGATAVEYGLILALVFLSMIFALRGVASVTIKMWNDVNSKSAAAVGATP